MRLILFLCFWGMGVCALEAQTLALDPNKQLSQYILDHWTTNEGLPANNIRKIHQTRGGFLWLGGFEGLSNFDGVRFVNYDKRNIPQLLTNAIYSIEEAPDDALWIGTESSGLFKYQQGTFKKIGLNDYFALSILVQSSQRLLVGTRNKGLFVVENEKIKPTHLTALQKISIQHITRDASGAIWYCTDNGLFQEQGNNLIRYDEKNGLPVKNCLEAFVDRKGNKWVGTTEGLAVAPAGSMEFTYVPELKKDIINRILEDANGSLWFGTSGGLYRKNALTRKIEKYPTQSRGSTPIANVIDLWADKEGSLWIGTYRNGLFRLKDGKFTNFAYEDGLAAASVGSVCELRDSSILLGMNNGVINRIYKNNISLFKLRTPLPEVRVFNIYQDSKGNLWISTFQGLLCKKADGTETWYDKSRGLPDDAIRITYEDRRGNIWIGTRWGGLIKFTQDKITIINRSKGLTSNFIMSINEDAQGNLLIGTNDGGLNVIQLDGKILHYSPKQGLASNLIFNTYTDRDGVVWLATNNGISRWKDGKFANFTAKDGLQNDSPFDIIEDSEGSFWLPTARGIVQVRKQELNDYAAGKIRRINWVAFNKNDGMKSEDCTGAAHSLLTRTGKIWVPTNGGAVVIDPQNMPRNHLKPMLTINSLVADNEHIDLHQDKIVLKADYRRLVIDYSALSLLASAKVKFKYRLENFDNDWVEAGTERQVTYTNIPPGEYTFRVIACNNDGVWNYEGAALKFIKQPYFYQTWWFYSLIVALLFLSIWGLFRWRIYALQQREQYLEAQVQLKTSEIIQQNKILETQRDEIQKQKRLVEKRNENITNSLQYAKRIQEAILPTPEELHSVLEDYFVFFQPKDIVSGDFYWLADRRNIDNRVVVAAVDCTGHGVPGAFMSMIGNDQLNEIVNLRGITEADEILNQLHQGVLRTLRQYDNFNRDGMDLVLCVIDYARNEIQFAGAKNTLYYIQNNELHEIKGDKLPIGGYYKDLNNKNRFTKHHIALDNPTVLYLFSDGYQDQFGEESRKKFSRKKIRHLLHELYQLPFGEQKHRLEEAITQWRGNEEQIDDMLALALKVSPKPPQA